MTKSILIAACALVMGLTTSAFAETKGETSNKTTEKSNPTETASATNTESGSGTATGAVLFWYSDDGQTSFGQGEEPDSEECDVTGAGCAKGYATAQPIPVPASATVVGTRARISD